jgi:hypothetical protein
MGDRRDRPTAEFVPLVLPGKPRRYLLLAGGPLLWVLASVTVAILLERSNLIEAGLLIAAASFALAFAVLGFTHVRRLREERAERG